MWATITILLTIYLIYKTYIYINYNKTDIDIGLINYKAYLIKKYKDLDKDKDILNRLQFRRI